MLCRCASPGGESSACIARAWSRVSRVPVGAGAQVPSPCLAATAAQTHLCCQAPTCHTNDAWRPTRAGATADRQQKQLQRGAGISAVHQRGAAVQQHAGARRPHSVVACCLCYDGGAPHAQSESFCLIGVLLMKAGDQVPRMRMPEGRVGIPKPLKQTINRQGPAGSRPHRRPRPKHRRREVARLGVRVSSA